MQLQGLVEKGYEIVSTGGSARVLSEADIPVTPVEDVTQFPEMLGGRVKTLHPGVHGGILARRELEDDMSQIATHSITPIDIVVVNLYPFRATVTADPPPEFAAGVENIDIGGPAMIRAAAKNHAHVTVVVDPSDYGALLESLGGGDGLDFRKQCAWKAFQACLPPLFPPPCTPLSIPLTWLSPPFALSPHSPTPHAFRVQVRRPYSYTPMTAAASPGTHEATTARGWPPSATVPARAPQGPAPHAHVPVSDSLHRSTAQLFRGQCVTLECVTCEPCMCLMHRLAVLRPRRSGMFRSTEPARSSARRPLQRPPHQIAPPRGSCRGPLVVRRTCAAAVSHGGSF